MLIATQLKRMFVFEENRQTIHLADPNPSWSVEQSRIFTAPITPCSPMPKQAHLT